MSYQFGCRFCAIYFDSDFNSSSSTGWVDIQRGIANVVANKLLLYPRLNYFHAISCTLHESHSKHMEYHHSMLHTKTRHPSSLPSLYLE